jgi:hypothetical protein
VLAAGAVAAEAEGPAAPDEGGIGRLEPLGDRSRSAGDERRVQGRALADDLLELSEPQDQRSRLLESASRGAMGVILEQQALADRFTCPEGCQAHRSASGMLLDCHCARDDEGEEAPRGALLEDHGVRGVRHRLDPGRQVVVVAVGEAVEESDLAEVRADLRRRGVGHGRKVPRPPAHLNGSRGSATFIETKARARAY